MQTFQKSFLATLMYFSVFCFVLFCYDCICIAMSHYEIVKCRTLLLRFTDLSAADCCTVLIKSVT